MSKSLYIFEEVPLTGTTGKQIIVEDDLNSKCEMHEAGAQDIMELYNLLPEEPIHRNEFLELSDNALSLLAGGSNEGSNEYSIRHIAFFLLVAAIYPQAKYFLIA